MPLGVATQYQEELLAVARGHLINRLSDRLSRPSTVPDVERFGRPLSREFPPIWSFLFDPSIDATNLAR